MTELQKKTRVRRFVRIVLKTVLYIFLLFIVLILLVLTPPVQNFLRKKAVTYLENKLHTKVAISSIYIGFPKNVVLKNIYLEDRQHDTLLAGGSVKADIALFRLIFKQEVEINSVQLDDITAKIKRQLPDTVFNYQFVIDAFMPPDTSTSATPSGSSSPLVIRSIVMNRARFVYKDVVTGNDVTSWIDHFDAKIDRIDTDNMEFDIPVVNARGVTTSVYQAKPLLAPSLLQSAAPSAPAAYPQLSFGTINFEKVSLDYGNTVSGISNYNEIGQLKLKPRKIDFNEQLIDIGSLALNNTNASLRITRKPAAREAVQTVKEKTDSSLQKGWRVLVGVFSADNNAIQFDNDNLPRQKTGFDYAHINVKPLSLHLNNFLLSNDSIGGQIIAASFRDQGGVELQELHASILYTDHEAYLHDLYLKTPGTELQRDLSIQYPSLAALQSDIGNLHVDLAIAHSKILVRDVLAFAPMLQSQPAFANPGATWYINSRIQGRIADLSIEQLQLQGLQDTKIDLSGRITGLPDLKIFSANLAIRNISSSRRDINMFVPPGTLPGTITLPNRISVSGRLGGNTHVLSVDLQARTDLGNAAIKGNVEQVTERNRVKYSAGISAESVDLGTILQDKNNFGPVTATLAVSGTGFDPRSATARFKGILQSATIRQYTYHAINLDGDLANQKANIQTSVRDPNLYANVHANADMSKTYPAVNFSATIDSIKTQPLHLTPDAMIYRGKIDADFPSTDPDNLQGKLMITHSLLVQNNKRLQLDTVQLLAGATDKGHYIELTSEIAYARLEGQYRLTQLGNVLQQVIQPYFNIQFPAIVVAPVKGPCDFTFVGAVTNSQPLQAFVPGLTRLDSIRLQSHFSNTQGWDLSVASPAIDYNGNHIRGLVMHAGSVGDSVQANIVVKQFTGASLYLYNTTIDASLKDNIIRLTANVKDRAEKDRYHFSALFEQPRNGEYSFSFIPGNLLLNYAQWAIEPGNKIVLSSSSVTASNFILSQGGQQLRINSLSQASNAPLEARFANFKLATITAFVQSDSSLVDGTINGVITFTDIIKDPIFKGDLTINDLSMRNDTAGNLQVHISNTAGGEYVANAVLSGRGNDVKLDGKYFMRENGNSNFDLNLAVNQLPLATAQAFSNGAIKSATGNVTGRFALTGTLKNPTLRGNLNFDKAGFNVTMLNNYFSIDGEKLEVNENGIRFNGFVIKDSSGNPLVLNGYARTENFRHYNFDFTIRANNFQALNSTKRDNKLFYGQLFFNSNLHVSGTETAPVVDGQLTVNEKTKMTIVLPQREPGVVAREGVVEFVNMSAPENDSLFMAPYDSLNTSGITGFDIAANITIDKNADFSLIIDEGNGDFLDVRGEATLTAGIDPSGKLTLAGNYELQEGAYELTFNFIKRRFSIEKGSKITWLGEPTDADIDITALYIANAAPLDLVKNELGQDVSSTQRNTYLQKLPFNVMLKMEGKLMKPDISFDIQLPDNKSYVVSNDIVTLVRNKLDILREEPSEINKQVFALLLLNRFIGENPFNSSSDNLNPNTLARQSVSKLLTEQLNNLAKDLIEGVDLNFDVLSSEDYTTGERRDRTDLNVGLSKRLLNDRLSVTVGSNFALEGPQNSNQRNNIAGDVAVNYRLSADGRYMLRAYRKNEYEGIIDGYIIETGVSFIISVDYNKFKQIFQNMRQRRKLREQRRKQREQQQQQPIPNQQGITSAALKPEEEQ